MITFFYIYICLKIEYIIPLSILMPEDGIDKSPSMSDIKAMLASKAEDLEKDSVVNIDPTIDIDESGDNDEQERRLKRKTWCKLDQTFPVDSEEGRQRINFLRKLKFLLKYVAGRRSYHNFVTGGSTL